jgi:RimJ/RimL family protein N-acetyltransferase
VSYRYWPLFGLRLSTADLRLRPMTEADLWPIADLLPDDVEQDPAPAEYDFGDARVGRGIVSHQSYWLAYGTWRPQAWRLSFVVRSPAGEILGVQELEGSDFLTLRTVDSSSFLVTGARGRGFGKQMRTAVLALAFGPLEAEAAITSAWHDNHASLGVSRALGYQPNGDAACAPRPRGRAQAHAAAARGLARQRPRRPGGDHRLRRLPAAVRPARPMSPRPAGGLP